MRPSLSPSPVSRRQWLQWSAASTWLAATTPLSAATAAATLPHGFLQSGKPVSVVVAGPAGGASDAIARVLAQAFQQQLQHEVLVENKPGAGGTIGSKHVSIAKNDGHTLLIGHIGTNVLSPLMQNPQPYHPVHGFTPIGQLGSNASVLIVPADGPRSLTEALGLWKQRGRYSYATTGQGSPGHLLGHLLADQLGVEGLHVPYRGSPFALQDLVGSRVEAMFAPAGAIAPYLDSQKIHALAVASSARSGFFAQLPTLREAGLSQVVNDGWFGLFAPAQTAPTLARAWHAHLNAALAHPQVQQQLRTLSVDIVTSPAAHAFAQFLQTETQHWSGVLAQMGDAFKAA